MQLEEALHDSSAEVGYDEPSWTPALVRRYLEEAFGVEYSLPSCRRLMKEVGLSYRPPRRTAAADPDDREGENDEVGGQWCEMEPTVVA